MARIPVQIKEEVTQIGETLNISFGDALPTWAQVTQFATDQQLSFQEAYDLWKDHLESQPLNRAVSPLKQISVSPVTPEVSSLVSALNYREPEALSVPLQEQLDDLQEQIEVNTRQHLRSIASEIMDTPLSPYEQLQSFIDELEGLNVSKTLLSDAKAILEANKPLKAHLTPKALPEAA